MDLRARSLTLTLSRMTRGPLTPVTVRYSVDEMWEVAVRDGAGSGAGGCREKRARRAGGGSRVGLNNEGGGWGVGRTEPGSLHDILRRRGSR